MLRREVHGERLFLFNNKSILFTNMVKWIEIDRSGAFYKLPAPLDLLSINGLFSGNGFRPAGRLIDIAERLGKIRVIFNKLRELIEADGRVLPFARR